MASFFNDSVKGDLSLFLDNIAELAEPAASAFVGTVVGDEITNATRGKAETSQSLDCAQGSAKRGVARLPMQLAGRWSLQKRTMNQSAAGGLSDISGRKNTVTCWHAVQQRTFVTFAVQMPMNSSTHQQKKERRQKKRKRKNHQQSCSGATL